ncbi:MAG TPA: sarcosine oxidase subunit gamma, partial [Novimethylophilus sp.]
MQTVIQPTPVAYAQKRLSPRMGALYGMEVALGYGDGAVENQRKQLLGACDVSCFPRFGVKGLNAVQWLVAHKVEIPTERNSWLVQESGALVLRLGNSEFLVEDQ